MTVKSRACKRCGGDLIDEEDDYDKVVWRCLQCGRTDETIVAEEPETQKEETVMEESFEVPDLAGMPPAAKGQFYRKHFEEIKKDALVLTALEMRKKWQISVSGWVNMKIRLRAAGVTPPHIRVSGDQRAVRKPEPEEKPVLKTQELAKVMLELEWYRGYRQAVLDISGNKGEN